MNNEEPTDEISLKGTVLTWMRDGTLYVQRHALGAEIALIDERDRLKARIAELEKDAARYRWIRQFWFTDRFFPTPVLVAGTQADMDTAVDAEIAAESVKTHGNHGA